MDKIKVKLKSSFNNEYKEFNIFSRESIENIINNLDKTKIINDTINLAKGTNKEGTFYVELDAEHGEVDTYWIKKGDEPLYLYNKYITLLVLPTGQKTNDLSNKNLLSPHMLELYNSILEGENISLDEDEVFKIVLDFFKTSKRQLLEKYNKQANSNTLASFDNSFIIKQLDNLYSNKILE